MTAWRADPIGAKIEREIESGPGQTGTLGEFLVVQTTCQVAAAIDIRELAPGLDRE